MIAKLVVWAEDRGKAISKLNTCLSKYEIVGPDTNIQFLRRLATHKRFMNGEVHTGMFYYLTKETKLNIPTFIFISFFLINNLITLY